MSKKPEEPKIKYRYVGPGMWNNVPAEDITEEAYERMPGDQRRIVLHSGAYKPVEEKAPTPNKSGDESKGGE